MIIEHFEFKVARDGACVYEGNTHFGFFTAEALAQQVGLRPSDQPPERTSEPDAGERLSLDVTAQPIRPLTPDDPAVESGPPEGLPADALRMFDRVITFDPQGGRCGLGLVRAVKRVDPQAWFFAAHFFQDPVCPGSLGLESILQLLKLLARKRWPEAVRRSYIGLLTDVAHAWTYRGQIRPHNKEVMVEAEVTLCEDAPVPTLQADGYVLVDGLYIYKMTNCGIRLVPCEPS